MMVCSSLAQDLEGMDLRRFMGFSAAIRVSGLRQKTLSITVPKGIQNMVPSFLKGKCRGDLVNNIKAFKLQLNVVCLNEAVLTE